MDMESILQDRSTFADFLPPNETSSKDGKQVELELVQTHLSYVCLSGDYAFKLKKSVNLGPPFANQSILSERKRLCFEELAKNREWNTNGMYLGVFPLVRLNESTYKVVKDSKATLVDDAIVDWVIWMRQFPSDMQLDKVLDRRMLDQFMVREFGKRLAQLQQRARRIFPKKRDEEKEEEKHESLNPTEKKRDIRTVIFENIDQLLQTEMGREDIQTVGTIRTWFEEHLEKCGSLIELREQQGKIRELHADMHSGNLFLADGRIEMFDCLEFSDELSQIDVMNDVAFLFMDFIYRAHEPLAWVFVDAWLEETGDFAALQLLTVFAVYRALVRCKIAALQGPKCTSDYSGYLALCTRLALRKTGAVVAMVGKSGSGKSFWAKLLVPALGAVRVRSDVERKRLFVQNQDDGEESKQSDIEEKTTGKRMKQELIRPSLYSEEATTATYQQLFEATRHALIGRVTIILDATFLSQSKRQDLLASIRSFNRSIAGPRHPDPVFVECTASDDVMRARIIMRQNEAKDSSDADLNVLAHQHLDPFTEEELVIPVVTDGPEADKQALLDDVCAKLRHALALDALAQPTIT